MKNDIAWLTIRQSMVLNNNRSVFIVFLSALIAFAPFSIDIYLASMPTIQQDMHSTELQVQLTLSLFFIGFALGQLVWGAMSDRIGRKATIFVGIIVYMIGSLLCAFSHSIHALIIFRLIQALGACVGIVMALAIVKDSFANDNMEKVIGLLIAVAMLAPMIAPIVGSYLLVHFGWRSNFYALFFYGLALLIALFFLTETHVKEQRKPLPINILFAVYYEQLQCKEFLVSTLAASTNFGVLFAFIASSPFIYIDIYHVDAKLFGYFFAANAGTIILGNLSSGVLKRGLNELTMIFVFLMLILVGSIVMLVAINAFPGVVWSVVLPLLLISFSVGVLHPKLMSYPLLHVVNYTGVTSSLAGTIRFSLSAFVGFIVGLVIVNIAWPLAIIILLLNVATFILMKLYFSILHDKV